MTRLNPSINYSIRLKIIYLKYISIHLIYNIFNNIFQQHDEYSLCNITCSYYVKVQFICIQYFLLSQIKKKKTEKNHSNNIPSI